MRILLLTNSYPTVHSPSGAAYITARLEAMSERGDVEHLMLALRPTYSPVGERLRSRAGLLAGPELALAPEQRDRYREIACAWGIDDVLLARGGTTPLRAVARATGAVLEQARRSGPFDVVHAHGMYALPAGEVARRVAAALGVPYVVTVHGSDLQIMARDRARATRTMATAAATTYVSAALRDRAAELGFPIHHAHVVPNGFDPEVFHPALTPDILPDEAERPDGPLDLLFVGNLLPVKGADLLPDILDRVRRTHPQARLTVAGDGPLRASLEAALPRERFLGRVPPAEVAELMRRGDVLLVPSRNEGWGCVVTESYACGTPVVATQVGGLPEAVGRAGSLVAPGADFAERFADAVASEAARPPDLEQMQRHVGGSTWAEVVHRELEVVAAALDREPPV